MDAFAHLHVHGRKSLLDGLPEPMTYARRAAQLGQPALALTDHGNLNDALAHFTACRSVGVKPIIGQEFYVAPHDRTVKSKVLWGNGKASGDADISGAGAYTHLTVLAKNAEGVRNLYRLQAEGYDTGFYRKNRIDHQSLAENARGLIVLSGCAGSEISTRLRLGQYGEADRLADWYKQTFGEDFFIEVMYHGIDFETALNRDLAALAERHGIEVVATNDAHYCDPEHSSAHSALLCVQSKSTLAAPAFSFSGEGYHLRSRREMETLPLPTSALDATLAVAERIEDYGDVFAPKLRFPTIELPPGWDESEALWHFTTEGIEQRVSGAGPVYWDRGRYEHKVICDMGYPGYFLILHWILKEAKSVGYVFGPARGSAGGSLVSFALGITDLDPIAHRLVFERFLNPRRRSLPDVDIDIAEHQRPQFIEFVRGLVGDDYFAQIGTYGTIGAKASLKDANRVLGGTAKQGDWYASQLPAAKFGRAPTIADYTGPKDAVYDVASGLYGAVRNEGIHPAGVVMLPEGESIRDLLPLRRPGGKDTAWVTGFDMHEVEQLGLVKMDFLGLRNLGIIDETLRMLGSGWDLPTRPEECNDPRTYDLLSRGDTLGVFQLDSPGMRGLLRKLRPVEFDEISAVLALYRPGPMGANAHLDYAGRKNRGGGWQPEWAIHPELETTLRPVLESTYGLIVFQEQILGDDQNPGVLNVVCGWDYADGSTLFDAMRKKNTDKMEAAKPEYFAAGMARGFSEESLTALWDTLVPFADYSFNRSHTAGYGLVAYWTAYLKANHPTEYMAAVLSSVADDPDKLPEYLAEVERMGIAILPPDINYSGKGFSPSPKGIHYGLSAIKGVGEKVYAKLEKSRPYSSVDDFFSRAHTDALNTGTLAALIGSGAMDGLTPYREELYLARETLSARAQLHRAEARAGQRPLWRAPYEVGNSGLRSVSQRQEWERQYLSVVLTQESVELLPTRPLTEVEMRWLHDLLSRNPGKTSSILIFGRARISLPSSNWPAVEAAVRTLGVFGGA